MITLKMSLTVREGGEPSHNPLPTRPLPWSLLAKSFIVVFWCELLSTRVPKLRCERSLRELHQNSQKWKLSLWPTKLPLFVVNQLAKSSQVKKKKKKTRTFCHLWLAGADAPHNGKACVLGMSDFSRLICFYPWLPSGSAGPWNPDTTLPTLLAFFSIGVHYL